MERKLASIQVVNRIYFIEGADKICQYGINGWRVVDQIGKYNVGDKVVYFEIDSWIPTEIAPFLSKGKEPHEYKGIKGEKLRTIRLRKALSQGLIMPVNEETYECEIDTDVSELLGVTKWEPPPEFTAANAKGSFPYFIPKTDQERIQNCYDQLKGEIENSLWEVTEKLEGSSCTMYWKDGEFGVCSRNIDLKDDGNTFWQVARKYKVKEYLENLGSNIALQGELIGPGIQGNIYGLNEHEWRIFDVFDIDRQQYRRPLERQAIANKLDAYIPLVHCGPVLATYDELLAMADGPSDLNPNHLREGLVFKRLSDDRLSFKVVSNKYLEKQ